MAIKAIIFDAFGTLFQVTNRGSAKTILTHITECGGGVEEKSFLEEWRSFYKSHTINGSELMTEREIFVGDSITDDILGPKALGIKTVWIDRLPIGGEHGQDYTINNLTELFDTVLKNPASES